ncbi:MAG: O-antigen ligase family protein [Ewingella americana]|jgi:O-antigen ligase|uniref:O-antigen ligase family protein n=1 Tax=Ewingella americana TaxID=41202 RepID=UPI002431D55E|nr:O-antigen ligase family protein [Ewingella americana]MCI1680497.1 O-antigen ligase family protein [Ewingella americana]MCI1856347.1 O-antigen ligase family protein [Ewingella americana]MCI1863936.1 O-antigen ligase family protein [Ewingella americana]MCI2143026.1 O-antigen ligase family protein [Ewingella americana]MCI2163911.1 O-antigen ligase family protein [Ewingella americana]
MMMHSLKKIKVEGLFYSLFILFIFISAIFCGLTRSNNIFHISALTFLVTLYLKESFRRELFNNKRYLYGVIFSAGYLIYISISNLWGDDPHNTISALTHSLYIIIFISMITSTYTSKNRQYMLDAAILGFSILAIYLISIDYQNLLTSRLISIKSPGPSNVIDVGGYFAIGIILSFISFKESHKKVYLYSAFLLFTALLLTQSRGPVIALLISLAITSHFKILTKKNVLYSLPILAAVAILFSYIGIAEILVMRFQELSTQVHLRTSIWQHSLEVISKAPFFGYGFEKELQFINYSGEHITTTHSLYLGVLLKGGLVGLALFLSLMGYGVLQAINAVKEERRLEAALFFFMTIFYISQGMFNVGNPSEAWYLFWFPLGLIISGQLRERNRA